MLSLPNTDCVQDVWANNSLCSYALTTKEEAAQQSANENEMKLKFLQRWSEKFPWVMFFM